MLATGNSQLDVPRRARDRRSADIDWARVIGFHMDEYVGLAADHPASFRRYLRERLVERAADPAFHYIEGDAPMPAPSARGTRALLREHPLDLCCLGIGENGHLAFNDPPVADFDDPLDVKVVELDARVPSAAGGRRPLPRRRRRADARHHRHDPRPPARSTVLAIVPEARKAEPVRRAVAGPDRDRLPGVDPAHASRTPRSTSTRPSAYFLDGTEGRGPVR